MSEKSKSGSRRFWLIAHDEARGMEILTIGLPAGGKALPVFSFEDEAGMFLGLGDLEGDWRVRVTTAGEIVSVLFGPCAGIEQVALDPLPGSCGALNKLLSVEREAFMEFIEPTPRSGHNRPGGSAGAGGRRVSHAPEMENDRKPIQRMTGARQSDATVRAKTRVGR